MKPLNTFFLSLIAFCTVLAGASAAFAKGADAATLMQRVLDRNDGTTEVSRVRLTTCRVAMENTRIVCTGASRVKVMDMVRKDFGPREKEHRTVTLILEPAGERGIGFLQYDYARKERQTDQWLYLSALNKVKRIVSGSDNEPKTGSFFGSELSYEDMEKRHLEDYTYAILGEEVYQGRACTVIESVPTTERAPKSNYSRALHWVDTARDIILKTLLYDRRGRKVKRIYFNDIRMMDGILVPMQILVLNMESRRRTIMAYEKIVLNVDVQDAFLTQRTLIDGAFRESNLKRYQKNLL